MCAAGLFPEKILFESFARCSFTKEMSCRSDKTAHIAQLNPQLQHLPFFCTKNAINSYGPGSSIRPYRGGSNCSGLGEHSQTVLPRWKSSPYFQLQLHRPEFFFSSPAAPKWAGAVCQFWCHMIQHMLRQSVRHIALPSHEPSNTIELHAINPEKLWYEL